MLWREERGTAFFFFVFFCSFFFFLFFFPTRTTNEELSNLLFGCLQDFFELKLRILSRLWKNFSDSWIFGGRNKMDMNKNSLVVVFFPIFEMYFLVGRF